MTNERSYSLENLEEWVADAIASDTTPEEIYECIISTVVKSVEYHRACLNHSSRLLSLLEDNVPISNLKNEKVISINDYWNGKLSGKEFEWALNKYGYEYTPESFKLDSPILHDVNLDGDSDNIS